MIDWQDLSMTQAVADGYGAQARPLDQVIRDAVASRKEAQPTLVWICDPGDAKENAEIEENIFEDEKIAIPLKRFVCLQGNVDSLPKGKLADELRALAPVCFFYDPAGKSFERLDGKAAASRSRFLGVVTKLWAASFDMKLTDFTRKMDSILDKMEKVEDKLVVLEIKRSRAGGSAARERAIAREEAKLEKEQNKLQEEETSLLASCTVKASFAAAPEAPEK